MQTNQEKLKLSISEINNDIEKELGEIETELALTRHKLDCLIDRKIKMREILAVKNAFEQSWGMK